ncbi:MAG TPA: MFS transporter, partial [Stellaceae bacterium]|nr:MFS transporter [Stellaceae bacterium]
PLAAGTVMLGLGYVAVGNAPSLPLFMLAQGLLVGVGSAAAYTPLVASVSLWFTRHRGIAIAICASGNTLAGTVWPTVLQHFFDTIGWRKTFVALGLFCLATMPPLILALRRSAPVRDHGRAAAAPGAGSVAALSLAPARLHMLLVIAGVMCCLAMSVPQVHLVGYARDLGYGVTRGAEMLSLMLGASLLSRVAFGWSADRIGGVANLLLGSTMQAAALLLYAFFDSLDALYAISALFGFVQSGIIPSYAIIVREYFPAREAATRLAPIAVANFAGMSLGAWMAGAIFDLTGSYHAAFLNGVLWNAVNIAIVAWLLLRVLQRTATIAPDAAHLPPRRPLPGR